MHYYLVHIQYLGYRYHGWIQQPKVKTIQGVVEKTLDYVLGDAEFKTLGASRTDAKVSANHMAFELFILSPIQKDNFIKSVNENLPSDIRIIDIKEVDSTFNVIQAPRVKEYIYLFSYGEKAHPFAAALMANFPENLDIREMMSGAKIFEGKHDFSFYTKSKNKENAIREVLLCEIRENDLFTANFFPAKSYVMHIHSKGFLRYQIRLIMSQLVELGRGNISLTYINNSLLEKERLNTLKPAPAAGLILNKIHYDDHTKEL